MRCAAHAMRCDMMPCDDVSVMYNMSYIYVQVRICNKPRKKSKHVRRKKNRKRRRKQRVGQRRARRQYRNRKR